MMKIIISGLGSIGLRHARILKQKYNFDLYAFRSRQSQALNELGIEELYCWDEVEELKPDVAFITNPTACHLETAIRYAALGSKIFLEKPIDISDGQLPALIRLIKEKHLVSYLAYNLRFHPIIEKLREYTGRFHFLHMRVICTSYLPEWRKNVDYRKVYSSVAELGGGVILDLSHEIDYTNYLLGDIGKITGKSQIKRSHLELNVEDYADILVETAKGPANIHLNYFSRIRQRTIQIDFEELSVVGDLVNNKLEEYSYQQKINSVSFPVDVNYTYEKQIEYFFDNIDNTRMMNNLVDAADLFKKVIEFKEYGALR